MCKYQRTLGKREENADKFEFLKLKKKRNNFFRKVASRGLFRVNDLPLCIYDEGTGLSNISQLLWANNPTTFIFVTDPVFEFNQRLLPNHEINNNEWNVNDID